MSDVEEAFTDIGKYIVETVTSEEFLQAVFDVAATVALAAAITSIIGTKRPSTSNERLKYNVRIPEPPRWMIAGRTLVGGAALFGEFDDDGNFWYVIVHSDSTLDLTDITYYCDNEPITVDPDTHEVLTAAFRLDDHHENVENDGDWDPYMWIWTTTYDADDPTPPGIAELIAALPTKWTLDHKLVGTTYSVIKMGGLPIEVRSHLYKWRGPFQMGEPSVAVLGNWSKVYDPRDVDQVAEDPTTYKFSDNTALIWAWFRTHEFGRNKAFDSVNWGKVAEQATICDETVIGDYGSHKRYACAVAIPDDRIRSEGENDIMISADAQLMFDTDGKCWPRVGYYEAPTLRMTRNRDVIAMASVEARNSENETQGVIVRYMEPDANYTMQPSAPWYNPLYYVPGEIANFTIIDIPSCSDHNQAMRLAKAIGMRFEPAQRLAPITSLRGLRAKRERIFNLSYDSTFTGDYEIYTPVKTDKNGIVCTFTCVPVNADRWDLLPGEEKPKPVVETSDGLGVPTGPTGVAYSFSDNRIAVIFDAPTRTDLTYQFQYIPTADLATGRWIDFETNMTELNAISGVISNDVAYKIRSRARAASGRSSAWVTADFTNSLDLPPVQAFNVSGGVGANSVSWINPSDIRHSYVEVYRDTSNDFSTATMVHSVTGSPNATQSFTDTLTPGTYYYWIRCFTVGGAKQSTLTGSSSGVVT